MAQSDSLYFFHLYLPGGHPSFFHDITADRQTPERVAHHKLQAFYGRDPNPPDVATFRKDLHHRISHAVRRECADAEFPVRFAVSSAAFLVSFLAFSLLFRFTPVPVRLIAAITAGTTTYLALLRKKCGSQAVKDRIGGLCSQLDLVVFHETRFIVAVEEIMEGFAGMSAEDMMYQAVSGEPMIESDSELGPPLCRYIEQRRRSRIPARIFRKLLRAKRLHTRDWKLLHSRCDDVYFPLELLALSLHFMAHHNYSDMTCSSKRIDSSSR